GCRLLRIATPHLFSLLNFLIGLLSSLLGTLIYFLYRIGGYALGIVPGTIDPRLNFGNTFFSHFTYFFGSMNYAFLRLVGKHMQQVWIFTIVFNRFSRMSRGLCKCRYRQH